MGKKAFLIGREWLLVLTDMGVHPGDVLRRAKLSETLFNRENARLTAEEYICFWRALEEVTGDLALPIRLVESISPDAFHPLIFAVLCSPNMSTATRRMATYARLFGPLRLHINETDGLFSISVQWNDPELELPATLAAKELAFITQFARIGTRERICPVRVEIPYPLESEEAYTSFFGVVPHQGSKREVTFKLADVHRPFMTVRESLWATFEPDLQRRLVKVKTSTPIFEQVQSLLLESLPSGGASIQTTARHLGLSPRTLQRRLKEEGFLYKTIVRTTREKLACHYLANPALTYAEIAFLIGFDEPSSFFRAFRSWTGDTPETMRLALTQPTE